MYYDPIECGVRISHLRRDWGLTKVQAAEKLNVSVQHYRAVEAGRRSASIELLIEIANTFQASLDYYPGDFRAVFGWRRKTGHRR